VNRGAFERLSPSRKDMPGFLWRQAIKKKRLLSFDDQSTDRTVRDGQREYQKV
jgi:hypothetical protein